MPREPGVYLMRNERGDLLYVGKAARLAERVALVLQSGAASQRENSRTGQPCLVRSRCASRDPSLEAALTEARLIRELKPPYNRMLKSAAPAYFLRLDLMDPFPAAASRDRS